jgi:tetratricopeptide (TPR) repeat protein
MHLWTTGENGDEHADRARSLTWLLLEKIPFLLLSAGSAIVTVIAQKSGGALRAEYGLLLRVENALVSYLHYLGKALWPSKLAALYPFPRNGVATWEVAAAVLAIIAVTYATLFLTQKRYFAVGWFWFLGTLVPVIGLVQVGEQAMADRYAYIPFVGLFIAVVWGLEEWASVHKVPPSILGVAVTIWIFALTMTAHAQMKYWASTTELWSHTLEVTGPNFVAEDNLGAELIKDGKIEAARARFQRAIDINSRDPFSHLDAGVCDQRLGNFQGAIAHYQAALQLSSERLLRATALSNLGSSYRKLGNYDPARRNFVAALQIDPQNVISLIGLGLVAQKTGDLATASIYYSQATHAQPWGITYILLAQALEKSGRRADAKAAMDRAKQSSPDLESDQEYADRLLRE